MNELPLQQPNEFGPYARKTAISIYGQLRDFGKPLNTNEVMLRTFAHQIEQGRPIPFVGFWGIGDKEIPDDDEKSFMNRLEDLQRMVKERYHVGAEITLILADMHGVFNGHVDSQAIQVFPEPKIPYLQQIKQNLEQRGMKTIWLSQLYRQFDLQLPDIHKPINENAEAYRILDDPQRRKGYLHSARHNRRGVEAQQAAYHYIRERLGEKDMLVYGFPRATLLVNGGRNLATKIVPEGRMPILYVKNGPVWF